MSKWQQHEKQPRDLWRTTDPDAVKPLIPFVQGQSYAEPCYGAGDLEDHLWGHATCVWRSDLEPQSSIAKKQDALTLTKEDLHEATVLITNPPYKWDMLQPLLDHLPTLKPCWFLLPADCMHNKRMSSYIKMCSDIVSVGRLYFHTVGEDPKVVKHKKQTSNYAWYKFTNTPSIFKYTTFWGRE